MQSDEQTLGNKRCEYKYEVITFQTRPPLRGGIVISLAWARRALEAIDSALSG